jgi:hypothetical protein
MPASATPTIEQKQRGLSTELVDFSALVLNRWMLVR